MISVYSSSDMSLCSTTLRLSIHVEADMLREESDLEDKDLDTTPIQGKVKWGK